MSPSTPRCAFYGALAHFALFMTAYALQMPGLERVLLEPVATVLKAAVPAAAQAEWYGHGIAVLAGTSLLWGLALAACVRLARA